MTQYRVILRVRIYLLSFSLLAITFALLGINEAHAARYYLVGETLNRMMLSPEDFGTYVGDNLDKFDQSFLNCVNENIVRRDDEAQRIWDRCYDLHTDPDFRNACFEDDGGLVLEQQIDWLQMMVAITNYGADPYWTLIPIIDAKAIYDPTILGLTWEELWTSSLPAMREDYACGSDDNDDGNCFIATATYGSGSSKEVRTLRRFRDEHLLTNSIGRAVVSFYYETSPPIAEFIGKHESARTLTRWVLTVIVFAIEHPLVSTASVLLMMSFIVLRVRSRRKCPSLREDGA